MSPAIEIRQIKNLTMGIDIFTAAEGQFTEVVEYDSHSLVCQLPKIKLSVGNMISVAGRFHIDKEHFAFEATGRIASVLNNPEDDMSRIQIHLTQIDKYLWGQFLKATASDQTHVDKLLAGMRGDEQ